MAIVIARGIHLSRGMTVARVSWPEHALMREVCRRGNSRRRISIAFGRSVDTVDKHCRGITRRRLRTVEERRLTSQDRRDANRTAGVCINGPAAGFVSLRGTVHGPVVAAGKCQRCLDVHAGRTPNT